MIIIFSILLFSEFQLPRDMHFKMWLVPDNSETKFFSRYLSVTGHLDHSAVLPDDIIAVNSVIGHLYQSAILPAYWLSNAERSTYSPDYALPADP